MSMTLEQAKEKLAKYGQEHVLKYYGELNEEEKQGILDQIETTDMSILEACKHKEDLAKRSDHTVGCHAVRRNRSKQGGIYRNRYRSDPTGQGSSGPFGRWYGHQTGI